MAVTDNRANSTPGEIKKGEDVPSNLDAARPVIDRIKDIDKATAEEGTAGAGGDAVIDNTPEGAAEAERAEADAKEAEKADTKARKETK